MPVPSHKQEKQEQHSSYRSFVTRFNASRKGAKTADAKSVRRAKMKALPFTMVKVMPGGRMERRPVK